MKLLNIEEIRKEFALHLTTFCGLSPARAEKGVADFPEEMLCYLKDEYIEDCTINNTAYEKVAYWTDLDRIGIPQTPNFFFYAFYKKEDFNHEEALYQCEELNPEDFRQLEYESITAPIMCKFIKKE